MDISARTVQGVHVLKLNGKLHLGEPVEHLRTMIEEFMASGENQIVLDLANVPLLDSSGIGALVKILTALKQKGGDLKLVNPTKFTVQTLKMIGVLNLFQVFESEAAAVEAFGAAKAR